jgi:hypothetical protein
MTNYWQLVEPVWDALVKWDDVSAFRSAFNGTDPTARTLFAAHWLYSEVNNGGFRQFYWNSTGILAPEAADAFELIGMPRTAQIIRRTISWFPSPYPRERHIRILLLDGFGDTHPELRDPFHTLDDEFYDAVEAESGGFVSAANDFANRRRS